MRVFPLIDLSMLSILIVALENNDEVIVEVGYIHSLDEIILEKSNDFLWQIPRNPRLLCLSWQQMGVWFQTSIFSQSILKVSKESGIFWEFLMRKFFNFIHPFHGRGVIDLTLADLGFHGNSFYLYYILFCTLSGWSDRPRKTFIYPSWSIYFYSGILWHSCTNIALQQTYPWI